MNEKQIIIPLTTGNKVLKETTDVALIDCIIATAIILKTTKSFVPKNVCSGSPILLQVTKHVYVLLTCRSVYRMAVENEKTVIYFSPETSELITTITEKSKPMKKRTIYYRFTRLWRLVKTRLPFIHTACGECVSPEAYTYGLHKDVPKMLPLVDGLRRVILTDQYAERPLMIHGMQALHDMLELGMDSTAFLTACKEDDRSVFHHFTALVEQAQTAGKLPASPALDAFLTLARKVQKLESTNLSTLSSTKQLAARKLLDDIDPFEQRIVHIVQHMRSHNIFTQIAQV